MSQRTKKAAADLISRLTQIRALTLAINNSPDVDLPSVANEYFYAVLDILEGKPLSEIFLYRIDREQVLLYLKEG